MALDEVSESETSNEPSRISALEDLESALEWLPSLYCILQEEEMCDFACKQSGLFNGFCNDELKCMCILHLFAITELK